MHIRDILGNTDVYLVDQILKGRFDCFETVLDVGCGSGRNLQWFAKNNFSITCLDRSAQVLDVAKNNLMGWNSELHSNRFIENGAAEFQLHPEKFDLIICNAVLHFSKNKEEFLNIINNMWDHLSRNGILFIRLGTSISVEEKIKELGEQWYHLPDGSERFLVSEQEIKDIVSSLKAIMLDPIKTTNVQNLRAMTTLCLKK